MCFGIWSYLRRKSATSLTLFLASQALFGITHQRLQVSVYRSEMFGGRNSRNATAVSQLIEEKLMQSPTRVLQIGTGGLLKGIDQSIHAEASAGSCGLGGGEGVAAGL